MRLYHPQHGYHFETGIDQVNELKVFGWVEAPKGFQNTLKEQEKPAVAPENSVDIFPAEAEVKATLEESAPIAKTLKLSNLFKKNK